MVPIDKWEKLILGLSVKDNYLKFCQVLEYGISEYSESLVQRIICKINPVLLISHPDIFSRYCTRDPMDPMFPMKEFIKLTDELNCCPPVQGPRPRSGQISGPGLELEDQDNDSKDTKELKDSDSEDLESPEIDFKKPTSLVFIYNGNNYYAHPGVVFEQIVLFKEIKDMGNLNFDEPIVLSSQSSGSVPGYIINLWLRSMYSTSSSSTKGNYFDLAKIRPRDIVCTLDHIDRYPTLSVSISSMEYQLIDYFDQLVSGRKDQSQWVCTRYLMDLSHRYGLKSLYLWIHNYKKQKQMQ